MPKNAKRTEYTVSEGAHQKLLHPIPPLAHFVGRRGGYFHAIGASLPLIAAAYPAGSKVVSYSF